MTNYTQDKICVLSNQHVMLGVGNHIFQPTNLRDRIGSVRVSVLNERVDAAIADFGYYDDGVEPEILDIGRATGCYDVKWTDILRSNPGYPVKKRGRTTRLTSGRIYSADFVGTNPGVTGLVIKKYKIAKLDQGKVVPGFADHGDSGSVVVNNSNRVVGLLTSMAGAGDESCCFATPIKTVLDSLQIEIWTG